MELRQIRSFIAAAEDGNISRAAQRLHLTQPALSRQIKGLEDEIGVPLLERGAHSFKLTPAGELLLREGRALLEHADTLQHKLRAAAKAQSIRVGYSPSLSAGVLPMAIEAFSQIHPKARVELYDLTTTEMIDGLSKGSLDVIVTAPPQKEVPEIRWETVQQQSWRVALPPQHPLQNKGQLVPGDLEGQRFVAYNQDEYPDYWNAISRWLRDQGINGRIASEADGLTSLIAAVEGGLGIALVVDRVACLIPDRIALKPLKPQPDPVCIAAGVLARHKPDKVLAVFIEELKRAGTVEREKA